MKTRFHKVGETVGIRCKGMTDGVATGVVKQRNGYYVLVEYKFRGQKILIELYDCELE